MCSSSKNSKFLPKRAQTALSTYAKSLILKVVNYLMDNTDSYFTKAKYATA